MCGTPSTTTCDLITSNNVKGTITQVSPGGGAIIEKIEKIRLEPHRYKFRGLTSANPTGNGEVEGPFFMTVGLK